MARVTTTSTTAATAASSSPTATTPNEGSRPSVSAPGSTVVVRSMRTVEEVNESPSLGASSPKSSLSELEFSISPTNVRVRSPRSTSSPISAESASATLGVRAISSPPVG
jgi:hypothetical protein